MQGVMGGALSACLHSFACTRGERHHPSHPNTCQPHHPSQHLPNACTMQVRMDCSDLGARPRAELLPLSRDQVVQADGTGARV